MFLIRCIITSPPNQNIFLSLNASNEFLIRNINFYIEILNNLIKYENVFDVTHLIWKIWKSLKLNISLHLHFNKGLHISHSCVKYNDDENS